MCFVFAEAVLLKGSDWHSHVWATVQLEVVRRVKIMNKWKRKLTQTADDF